MVKQIELQCPSCQKAFAPGETWFSANACRGLYLLDFIEDHQGMSGWELSEASGMEYRQVVGGLQKLRDAGVVKTEVEERDQGGIRFRYWPILLGEKHGKFYDRVVTGEVYCLAQEGSESDA